MLSCSTAALWAPKQGNTPAEYEDAYAQHPAGSLLQGQSARFAVADGASESTFADIWAKQLVRSYCQAPFNNRQDLQARLEALGGRWERIVFRRPLPWFAEEKARLGAAATLLGMECSSLTDQPAASGEWQAVVVGDSCLFHVRQGTLRLAWPLTRAQDFNNAPDLVFSSPINNRRFQGETLFWQDTWQAGDLFLLATDALAAWFLGARERGERPWEVLKQLAAGSDAQPAFLEWTDEQRSARRLRNDDTTCVIVEML
jgi:hypothetical protein